jgi:hypothetical protein
MSSESIYQSLLARMLDVWARGSGRWSWSSLAEHLIHYLIALRAFEVLVKIDNVAA